MDTGARQPPSTAPGDPARLPRAPSLPESHRTVFVPQRAGFLRKMWAFSGPGYLVAVGYMDPGNWATDLAGGSKYEYKLLSVILLSNLMALLLHHLCARLGIVTGRDLAQACRDRFSRRTTIALWLLCEVAICACDLAEVIGSAIGLQLLFGIPLALGVCLTAADVLLILMLQHRGFRLLEAVVVALITTTAGCFACEIIFSGPSMTGVLAGLVPSVDLLRDRDMLYVAIGILGATVMPHNLYLHSSIVQTRMYRQNEAGKREAVWYATLDSCVALTAALLVNGAILIVAAATFHTRGRHDVAEIQDAFKLLTPMLGAPLASVLFAVALLASGQNSTLTGTLTGQITMEGFVNIRLRPWLRRLITRLLAVIPAVICVLLYGEHGTTRLLILSQVVLSLQLPFAVIPLVMFVSDRSKMGVFAIPLWIKSLAWLVAGTIVMLNAKLLYDIVAAWATGTGGS